MTPTFVFVSVIMSRGGARNFEWGGRDAEGVKGVGLGGGDPLTIGRDLGSGEGTMPPPQKILKISSRIDYILEHFNALLN